MATYDYLCRQCGFRSETPLSSCPACGALHPLEKAKRREEHREPKPPPEAHPEPEPSAGRLHRSAEPPPRPDPPPPFRPFPSKLALLFRAIRSGYRYIRRRRLPRPAVILAAIVLAYIGYIAIGGIAGGVRAVWQSFNQGMDELWAHDDTEAEAVEQPPEESDAGIPSTPAERANTTRVLTGVVRPLHDPGHPDTDYQVVTGEGDSLPVRLSRIDVGEWVGREVRLTIRYAEDGVRFRILVWERAE